MSEKKRGNPREINQKSFHLKVDFDLVEYLQGNKPVNRFINNLIRREQSKPMTFEQIKSDLNRLQEDKAE